VTTGFARIYGGLFLATQLLGLVTGIAAITSPNFYLMWIRTPGSAASALVLMGLSLAWPIYVVRARLAWPLMLLAFYHLGGIIGMELYRQSIVSGLLETGRLSAPNAAAAAAVIAIQDPDLALVSLGDSAFGLIGGLQLMALATPARAVRPGKHPGTMPD